HARVAGGWRGPAAGLPPGVAAVGVEVVGDLAHRAVDRPTVGPEAGGAGFGEAGEHVLHVGRRGLGAVAPPHHHGRVAHLAVGDPAHLVLVVPVGEAGRLAQLAALLAAAVPR